MHSKEVLARYEDFFRILWNLIADTVERRVLWHCAARKLGAPRPADELHDVYTIVHASGTQRTAGMTAFLGLRGQELQLTVLIVMEDGTPYYLDAADPFREIVANFSNVVKRAALSRDCCEACDREAVGDTARLWE